jgi:hypothetical protein
VSEAARIAAMQIDRRFADYALTGGFFLICHLGMLWALGYWPSIHSGLEKLELSPNTPLVASIVTGFVGALAVIAVFTVGLILDLLASILRGPEMRIFARHLDHNSEWMTSFIEAHKAYCGSDYETFRRAIHELPTPFARLKRDFTDPSRLWRREEWCRLVAEAKFNWGFGLAPEYERLLNFFTSYIMGQSGSVQLTLMADQYSLWRTARAIATALCLLSIEAIFVLNIVGSPAWTAAVYPLVICGTTLGVMALITRGTYSRLCFTLFSLLYVACHKLIMSRKDAEPAP